MRLRRCRCRPAFSIRARPDLCRDRLRRPQPAQVAGTGDDRNPRPAGVRSSRDSRARVLVQETEQSIFDGLDVEHHRTRDARRASRRCAARRARQPSTPQRRRRCASINRSNRRASCRRSSRVSQAVRAARQLLPSLTASPDARADADFLLAFKERISPLRSCIRAAGVIVDPLAEEETVVPGGVIGVNVRVFLTQPSTATVVSTTMKAPPGGG